MLTYPKILENISILSNTPIENWAKVYVDLKVEFCRNHQMGMIFSTRFGAAFFDEMKNLMESNEFLKPDQNEILGDYDKNINTWLKIVRNEK